MRAAAQSVLVTLALGGVLLVSGFGTVRYTLPVALPAPEYPRLVKYQVGLEWGALTFDFADKADTGLLGRVDGSRGGPDWTIAPNIVPKMVGRATGWRWCEGFFAFPMWVFALASAIMTSQHVAKLSRAAPNDCHRCRYDLTGLSSTQCPQCGADVLIAPRAAPPPQSPPDAPARDTLRDEILGAGRADARGEREDRTGDARGAPPRG